MGEERHDGLSVPGRVILAREAPFALGLTQVVPAIRRIAAGESSETLEPRVMQVLVVLFRARGAIVTRDELIHCCWDGRIVSDDAVNRIISRIRQIAGGIGEHSFGVETITKVGYRLREKTSGSEAEYPAIAAPDGRLRPSRRSLIAAGLVAGGLAVSGAVIGLRAGMPSGSTRESRRLYDLGVNARLQASPDGYAQAEAYFRQAVQAAPDYADAWAAVALMAVALIEMEGSNEIQNNARKAYFAARQALALQADHPDALLALVTIPATFRRWREAEDNLAALPLSTTEFRHAPLKEMLFIKADVGAWAETLPILAKLRVSEPYHSGLMNMLVTSHWALGDIEAADSLSLEALDRWPKQPGVWFTRMLLLTYGGMPERALAFASDPEHHPSDVRSLIETRRLAAQAIVTRDAALAQQAKSQVLDGVRQEIGNVPQAVRLFAALGEVDETFELLSGYFYRRGRYVDNSVRPINRLTRLQTAFLFLPSSRPLWDDPRFAALTARIGLDDYWRAKDMAPPHRTT